MWGNIESCLGFSWNWNSKAPTIHIFKKLENNFGKINHNVIYLSTNRCCTRAIYWILQEKPWCWLSQKRLTWICSIVSYLFYYGPTLTATLLENQLVSAEQDVCPKCYIPWNLSCCQHKCNIWILSGIHFYNKSYVSLTYVFLFMFHCGLHHL